MTIKHLGPKPFSVPEYTDEEAANKSTQEVLSSRCIFCTDPDGRVSGLTGGARELIKRSDAYMQAREVLQRIELDKAPESKH